MPALVPDLLPSRAPTPESVSTDDRSYTRLTPPVIPKPINRIGVPPPNHTESSGVAPPISMGLRVDSSELIREPVGANHAPGRHGMNRVISSISKEPIPDYPVKLAKDKFGEKAVGWLLEATRDQFLTRFAALLARWGVRIGHQGTCVPCPEKWRAADTLKLLDLMGSRQFPDVKTSRASYRNSDHTTTLARAAAWFVDWRPRRGVELDNFLGCGDHQKLDASHLCHHKFCLFHVILEPAPINQSRYECLDHAHFLRAEGHEVPECCTKHSPPCLMQVSSSPV